MKLGCVIMASGEGKRFGSNKMLADIYGEPLIARTIDSVPRGFDVVVSTRWPEAAQICDDKHCPCVLHDGELRSESVRAGLSWGVERNWKGCLFLPGDQPLVSSDSFEAMVRAFDERGRKYPVRLACNGEPSSPVLFPAELFDALMCLEGKDGRRFDPQGPYRRGAGRGACLRAVGRRYRQGTATHNGAYRRLLVF